MRSSVLPLSTEGTRYRGTDRQALTMSVYADAVAGMSTRLDTRTRGRRMAGSSAELHEDPARLSEGTIDRHRVIVSLMEELEAINYYNQSKIYY